MTWLVWRQHRKQLLFGVAALFVLGAMFVAIGMPMHDRFDELGLPACLPEAMEAPVVVDNDALDRQGVEGAPAVDEEDLAVGRCAQSARDFFGDYQNSSSIGLLLLTLPMLAGMFWGAPLVAREIEHGTHRLVWTQGVSRLRWPGTKIGLLPLLVMPGDLCRQAALVDHASDADVGSAVRIHLLRHARHRRLRIRRLRAALGVFAGAVTGRMLPAMATTVVGFLGARLLVMLAARARYLPTETRVLENIAFGPDIPQMRNDLSGDWIVSAGSEADSAFAEVLTIHPVGQFWAFQYIETAIFVALAIGLIVATIYWVRRRITQESRAFNVGPPVIGEQESYEVPARFSCEVRWPVT